MTVEEMGAFSKNKHLKHARPIVSELILSKNFRHRELQCYLYYSKKLEESKSPEIIYKSAGDDHKTLKTAHKIK